MSFEKFIEIGFGVTLFGNALLFVPQIISLIKKKKSEGLSLVMFAGFNVMQVFTILHAYFAQDFILMLGFGLSFILTALVTFLIIFYRIKKGNIIDNASIGISSINPE